MELFPTYDSLGRSSFITYSFKKAEACLYEKHSLHVCESHSLPLKSFAHAHARAHACTHARVCTSTHMHACTRTALRGACCGLKNRWQWRPQSPVPSHLHSYGILPAATHHWVKKGSPLLPLLFLFVFKRKVTKEPVSAIREFLCLSSHAMAAPDLPGELSLLYSSPVQPICRVK